MLSIAAKNWTKKWRPNNQVFSVKRKLQSISSALNCEVRLGRYHESAIKR